MDSASSNLVFPGETDAALGQQLHARLRELYPLHRSITGDGLRQTLRILQRDLDLNILEVPSGTRVLDWEIPQEWTIRDAAICPAGTENRIVDYHNSNLHVVSYSTPVQRRMTFAELDAHLHSLPEHPDWIPYRTSFFRESWGFCVTDTLRRKLAQEPYAEYDVKIDAELKAGSLSVGEAFLPGDSADEILIYAHTCHPSLANDNLSGIVVAAHAARCCAARRRKLSYRFVFAPATIGAIAYLSLRRAELQQVRHGLILTLLGDAGPLSYKRTRRHHAEIDRAVSHVMADLGLTDRIEDFSPFGYDERQFGSPGFNLPVGVMMRSRYGSFPEYHTSADSLDFVKPESLADSARHLARILKILEENGYYRNLHPDGEPMLGRYGIYRAFGEADDRGRLQQAIMWILNLSDGETDLLAIAERSRLPFVLIQAAAELLTQHNLLERLEK